MKPAFVFFNLWDHLLQSQLMCSWHISSREKRFVLFKGSNKQNCYKPARHYMFLWNGVQQKLQFPIFPDFLSTLDCKIKPLANHHQKKKKKIYSIRTCEKLGSSSTIPGLSGWFGICRTNVPTGG